MKRLLTFLLLLGPVYLYGQCPTNANSVIEVCNDASEEATITATFNDGTPPFTYVLFDLSGPTAVSDPFGPVTVTEIAPNIVQFGLVPDGDYVIRVNGPGPCTSIIGGFGINVNSANAMDVSSSVSPACTPGTGAIDLTVTGGVAPYSFAWSGPTAIGDVEDPVNLDAGTYDVTVTDANNCTFDLNGIFVAIVTTADAGSDQLLCSDAATLAGNNFLSGEQGTWTVLQGSGSFSPDANTPNATVTGLSTGINEFRWTITDLSMTCPGTTDEVIIEWYDLQLNNTGDIILDCNGDTDGAGTFNVSGGRSSFSFSTLINSAGATITNNANSVDFSNAAPGTISIEVTDIDGCTAESSVVVTEPLIITASTSTTDASCNGLSDGIIDVTASGGTGTLEYSLDGVNFQASNQFTGLSAGSYTVTVRDANLCTITVGAVINEPLVITVSTSTTDASCNGGSDGTIDVTASGGTGTLEYSLDGVNFQASNQFTGLSAGSYTVTVRDANLCTITVGAVINEPLIITASTSITDASCNGGSDGTIDVTASGGTGTLEYSLDGVNFQASNQFTGLSAGSYTVTVRDANLCTITVGAVINEPLVITASTSTTDITCNGLSDGIIDVTASGGTGTLEYSLDGVNFQASNQFTGLSAGSYTVTVRDANLCTITVGAVINEPLVITASTSTTDITCNGLSDGIIDVTASGGTGTLEYSLDGVNFQASNQFTGLSAGSYTVTVRDANLCTITVGAVINEPLVITASTSTTDASCNGGSDGTIDVTASGGTGTLEYSLDGVNFQASNQFTGLSAGSYTVTVRDANLCTITVGAVINEPLVITASTSTTDASCNGGSDGTIDVTASGGTGTLEYSLDGVNFQTSNQFTGLSAGSYTVTVRDANLCTITVGAVINEPLVITASTSTTDASCNGLSDGIIDVTASGGTGTLEYSLDGVNFQASNQFTGLSAGSYTVTVRDANLCTITVGAVINEPLVITVSTSTTDASCNGGSDGTIDVTASGGTGTLEYSLDGVNFQASNQFTGLSAGSYIVTVRDANLCTITVGAVINEPLVITASTSTTDASCNGLSDGIIDVTASGGTGTLEYSLDGVNFQTSNQFTGLSAGSYTVTVRDANLCTITVGAVINEPLVITASTSITDASCNGGSDGTIDVTASGGTGTLEYSLDGVNFQASNQFTGLSAGSYTVTVRDANLCTITVGAVINEPLVITVSTSTTDASCNGGSDGTIDVTASGGTGTLEYSLDGVNFQASNQFTGLSAGSYTVTVRDANLCTITVGAVINEPLVITASTSITDASCNGLSDGIIDVTASGGTGTLEYSLDGVNFQASNQFTGLSAGSYTVTVRDANLCTITVGAVINEPLVITASTSTTDASCNGLSDGIIDVTASGGTGPLEYSLDGVNFQTSNQFTGLSVGSYTVTVRDANLCTITVGAVINEPLPITINVTTTDATCSGVDDGVIEVTTVSGGVTPYSYTVDGGASQASNTFSGLSAGDHDIQVIDANGCLSAVQTVTIGAGTTISIDVVTPTDATCSGVDDGVIEVTTVSGGVTPYSYTVDGGASQASNTFSGLSAGDHDIQVIDANGCLSAVQTVTIGAGTTISIDVVTPTDATCSGVDDGVIEVTTVSGGVTPYSYTVDGGASQASNTFSGLSAGDHDIQVIDANGCLSAVQTVTIGAGTTISIDVVTPTDATCSGVDDGVIEVTTVSGGVTPYSYTVDGGASQASNTFSGLSAGDHDIQVIDANGCLSAVQTVTIGAGTTISIDVVTPTDATCSGVDDGVIEVTTVSGGVTPYSYTVDGGASQASNTFSGLSAGDHDIQVIDANGCLSAVQTVTIGAGTTISIDVVTPTDATCSGVDDGVIEVTTVSGGVTPYSYTVDGGASQASNTFSGLSAGDHDIQVIDANGCLSAVQTVTIGAGTTISIDVVTPTDATCSGVDDGVIEVTTVSGGVTPYSYTVDGGASQASNTFSGLSAGDHDIQVIDANGCLSAVQTVTIGAGTTISIDVVTPTDATCSGVDDGVIEVTTVSGGVTPYSYTVDGGASQASNTFSGLSAGDHDIQVIDANGCLSAVQTVTIGAGTTISIDVVTPTDATCSGVDDGVIEVTTVSGGVTPYSYTVDGGASQASNTFSGLSAGDHDIQVIDANGCLSAVQTVTIGAGTTISIDVVTPTDATCSGVDDGVIEVTTVSGGVTPYSYTVDGGASQASNTFSGLSAGDHDIQVIDANGCLSAVQTVTIGAGTTISIDVVTPTDATCSGVDDGVIEVTTVSGGVTPYSYTVDGGASQASNTFSGLSAGDHDIQVIDANGCLSAVQTVTIGAGTTISIDVVTPTDATCSGVDDGVIEVTTVSGGVTPYSYTVDGGASQASNTFSGLSAGDHDIQVIDANGCLSAVQTVTIGAGTTISIDVVTPTDATCSGVDDGVIEVTTVSGGVTPYSYTVDGGASQASNTFSGLSAGDHDIQVIDANGCLSAVQTVTIGAGTTISIDVVTPTDATCSGVDDGVIEVTTVSGGVTPYSYTVDGGASQASNTFSGLSAGDHDIQVIDANGCLSAVQTVTIGAGTTISIDVVTPTDATCSGVDDGVIEVTTVSGGVTPYSYTVDGGASQASNTFSGLSAGDHDIQVIDANGCLSAVQTVTIGAGTTISIDVVTPTDATCSGVDDGVIEVTTVSGGVTPYSYTVDGGASQASNTFSGLSAGDHDIQVIDANGCLSAVQTVTIGAGTTISIDAVNVTDVTCAGSLSDGQIDIVTVSGGVTPYQYSIDAGATFQSNQLFTNLTPGTYNLVAMDVNGCLSTAVSRTIAAPPSCGGSNCFAFTKNIVSITRPDCDDNNGAFRLEITGTTSSGLQVIFEAGSGLGSYSVASPSNTLVIAEDSLSAGIYRYSISDGAGNTCSFADSFVELKELSSVDAELLPGSETAVECFGGAGGTVTLTGLSGSFTGDYWYNASGIYVPLANDRIVRNLPAGTTTILVAGAKPDGSINLSCPAEVDVTIFNSNTQITLTTSTTDASCDNNDGSITITSISGGTGSYSYRLDGVVFSDLPSGGKFENLAGGNHILTVIDDGVAGCERDFNIVVPFPGLVDFSTNPVDPDCSNNTASNGEIEVIIHSIGQFQVGISTDQTTDPTEFFDVSSNGFGSFTFDDLAKGDYYVTVVSTGATCPNRRLVSISDGPSAVNFDYKLGCITGGVNRELLLSNIKGENTSQYTLRVFDNFTSDLVDEVTFTLNSGQQFLIQNRTFLNFNKEYRLRLVQEQAACPEVEIVYEHPEILRIPTKLFALVGETTSSLPDKFTGSMQIHEFSGGEPPYLIRIELDSAAVPGQSYITDYDTVRLNNNLEFERIYEDIPAGRYFIEVSDELGCVLPLTGRVPLNTDLFVPNIFTPNGDGYNDTFFVRNLPEFDVELVVTNRWGTEVYKSDDYKNDWTGDDIPDGIYFYKIDVAGEVYNGWVEIMRGKP
ncbi:gliding motility-associated C-terminal domain-containing protein [Fulvivirga ulvae]|uniref:T9SS type B sorting domain-containing protein n=1 Tax=Fulvivirga ulvae TaxID=2904245 RepID=UPI001F47DC2B|nr:gliding motility-associated C-terminal domain-containing protein [Fulvivirga ulvae]UII30376.1 gliding motility-associated C-terminal domain-containing protein [Fulvivirga ulvae]